MDAKQQEEVLSEVDTSIEVTLLGEDGNAMSIIGACNKAARRGGWSEEQCKALREEMTSGDYNHVLQTAMKYFNVG